MLAGDTNAVLTISNLVPGSAGSYSVVVSNSSGSVTSSVPAILTVNVPPLAITTFAGTANSGGSADGLGAAARFNYPWGVGVDITGNIYVADSQNGTIRKITTAGQVSTLGGARFNFPTGVAVDGAGNVYVAENNGNTIQKITPTGNVSTLAGLEGTPGSADGVGSAARFYVPNSVAVDSVGNIYVADFGNHTIRAITTNGVVTTLAGLAGDAGNVDGIGNAARFNRPFGVAVDGAGNVYVADALNSSIRKITVTNQVVTTLAGSVPGSSDGVGTSAGFNVPSSVAVDSLGNVYVADYGNYLIRKLTPDGVVSTMAGAAGTPGTADGVGSAARFGSGIYGPSGVAVDAQGQLYVAEYGSSTIRKGILDYLFASPSLIISRISTNTILVSWPAAFTGFSLQQVSSLGSTNWVSLTNLVNVIGNLNEVTITPAGSERFYRLTSATP
jgi:sugar lactone lactonase YvrE